MEERGFDDVLGRRMDDVRARQGINADSGGVQHASGQADTDWGMVVPDQFRPGVEKKRETLVVPSFEETPCPPVWQMGFVCSHRAGVAPPWRVRVSQMLVGAYWTPQEGGIRRIAKWLALQHCQIVMTPDGRHLAPMVTMVPEPLDGQPDRMVPQYLVEYVFGDQMGGAVSHSSGRLILPDLAQAPIRSSTAYGS